MYDVTFFAYCGMVFQLARGVTLDDARDIVRIRIRRARRQQQPVERIDRRRWEFQTPEDAAFIADNDGVLTVKRHRRSCR
jgi:hypothetical protein